MKTPQEIATEIVDKIDGNGLDVFNFMIFKNEIKKLITKAIQTERDNWPVVATTEQMQQLLDEVKIKSKAQLELEESTKMIAKTVAVNKYLKEKGLVGNYEEAYNNYYEEFPEDMDRELERLGKKQKKR